MSELESDLGQCEVLFQTISEKVEAINQTLRIKSNFGRVDLNDAIRNIMLRIENIC